MLLAVLPVAAPADTGPIPGEEYDYKLLAQPGKYTIVDFYSDDCGPCLRISPMLDELALAQPRVAIARLDIDRPGTRGIDWRSPLARQYSLRSIPHFKILSPSCALIAEGDAAFDLIASWIDSPASVPEVSSDSLVTFVFHSPRAKTVAIAGTFNNWSISQHPLVKEGNGRWSVKLPLGPGRYEYKFVVDRSTLVPDPKASKADDGAGGKNSLIIIE